MADDKPPADASTEATRALARVRRNLAAIDRMLHDLVDLASIDAARFVIDRAPVELSALVADVLDRAVATRERECIVMQHADKVVVIGDAPRLERVVCTLIQNALKYAFADAPIAVRLDRRGRSVRVSVIDSRPGLAADEASSALDKFHRAPSTRGRDGNALGLYVSRRIVEAHDGVIGVNMVPGHGSHLFFELPIR